MSSEVIRITMFKIPRQDDQEQMSKAYEHLKENQQKEGKPYLLSIEAGPSFDNARNQGFNFIAKTVFKNKADHDFYDTICPAHKHLEAVAKLLDIQGMVTNSYTPSLIWNN
ncbi:MAG: hypothetical protein M1818_002200 [Claussenomyces sp. TS43310]|nr:MAG: hypothetical protein M1818_002200 [Claussenomyces sp. TS43310]